MDPDYVGLLDFSPPNGLEQGRNTVIADSTNKIFYKFNILRIPRKGNLKFIVRHCEYRVFAIFSAIYDQDILHKLFFRFADDVEGVRGRTLRYSRARLRRPEEGLQSFRRRREPGSRRRLGRASAMTQHDQGVHTVLGLRSA